jgi:hypothetical protein
MGGSRKLSDKALLQNVDPQMPPERLLPPGAARFAEEVSLPFETESEEPKSAGIREEFVGLARD